MFHALFRLWPACVTPEWAAWALCVQRAWCPCPHVMKSSPPSTEPWTESQVTLSQQGLSITSNMTSRNFLNLTDTPEGTFACLFWLNWFLTFYTQIVKWLPAGLKRVSSWNTLVVYHLLVMIFSPHFVNLFCSWLCFLQSLMSCLNPYRVCL